MPATTSTSTVRPSPYPLLVPQLTKLNSSLKSAKTATEREEILSEMKKTPELFNAFLRQNGETKEDDSAPADIPSEAPTDAQYSELITPEFEPAHKQTLMEIYNILTTEETKEKREAALWELKKTPAAMMEFMKKTLPPSSFLPPITEDEEGLDGAFTPTIRKIYEGDLAKLYAAIRAAQTPEEREKVFSDVIEKPHFLQEFLKVNVPQLRHL